MKKIIAALAGFLLCASAFATDIRQVMFGNNYETIKEIDSEKFFEKYPESKIINRDKFEERGGWEEKYYRVYKQVIGDKTFYRLQASPDKLTDDYILNWRNHDENTNRYRVQLFMEDGDYLIAVLDTCVMNYDWEAWEHGTTKEYDFVEIIQRNNKVKGFLYTRLVDKIDRHDRIEEYHRVEETYINTAEYYLFDDVMNNATENFGKVKYARNYSGIRHVSIEASQPLIDSKRPFMYTINNAFDGNAGTAYVENTEDDLFDIYIGWENSDFTKNAVDALKITNGYAKNKELYYANNRIKCIVYYSWDDDDYKEIEIDDRKDSLTITLARFSGTFSIVDKYKGGKYNDTCVSEIDFHFILTDWLIGE